MNQLFKGVYFFLYVSIYIHIYNALYARGTIHNNTIGMAHKKQVEKLNSTWWTKVCFRNNAVWRGEGSHVVQLLSEWSR